MASSRYYQKGNPEKELLTDVAAETNRVTPVREMPVSAPISGYTKPEGTLLPQALFVIYSGGTEREKDYFRLIDKNSALFPFIRIAFHAEPNFEKGGKPSIMQFAIDKTNEYKDSATEENPDKYFLLSDVDHFEQFLSEMKQECADNSIELIISNSCFEVWLYYAEKSDRCTTFNIPQDKLNISSAFKTWANTQIKGGLKPKKAIFNIEQNIKNAKNNYFEIDGLPTLFSTQMFRLAEQMFPYVKFGLKELKNKNLKSM